jgi:septum formation protein
MDDSKPAFEEVARVSRLKAFAVERSQEDIVVAADTVVVCDHQVLGKPKDEADAFRMLRLLSGRDHQVMTGFTVLRGGEAITRTEVTHIHFRNLSRGEILAYIATGEPMDKAGAYGIQGGAALFATHLDGDYYNVMGLPVCRLAMILRSLGLPILGESK